MGNFFYRANIAHEPYGHFRWNLLQRFASFGAMRRPCLLNLGGRVPSYTTSSTPTPKCKYHPFLNPAPDDHHDHNGELRNGVSVRSWLFWFRGKYGCTRGLM